MSVMKETELLWNLRFCKYVVETTKIELFIFVVIPTKLDI
jgi:hypothetical protein